MNNTIKAPKVKVTSFQTERTYEANSTRTFKNMSTILAWGFSRQEYGDELPCAPPGDLPNPGIKPRPPALQADSLPRIFTRYIYLAASGLSCFQASLVVACGLAACRILVPQPGIKLASLTLEGRFLTPGPPGKSPTKTFKRPTCLQNFRALGQKEKYSKSFQKEKKYHL